MHYSTDGARFVTPPRIDFACAAREALGVYRFVRLITGIRLVFVRLSCKHALSSNLFAFGFVRPRFDDHHTQV